MRPALILTGSLALSYIILAWLLVLPPFKPDPVFYQSYPAKGETQLCVGGGVIHLRFESAGRVAIVKAGDAVVRLPYKASYMDDLYEVGGWQLRLDPEIMFTGPNGCDCENVSRCKPPH